MSVNLETFMNGEICVAEQQQENLELREARKTAKAKYGFLPTSIWHIIKSESLMRYTDDTMRGSQEHGGNPLSEFSPDVAKRIVMLWSDEGDIVLDPFGNRGSIVMMARLLNRASICNEIVPTYYNHIKEKVECNKLGDFAKPIRLINGDARCLQIDDASVDLIATSPPFWDVEKYESTDGQMSDITTYQAFLLEYEKSIKECNRVLKNGRYCVFVVNDIRREKTLIPFHADTINIFMRNGFQLHDIIINVLNSASIQGIGQAVENKYTAKMHEYILVFKKVAPAYKRFVTPKSEADAMMAQVTQDNVQVNVAVSVIKKEEENWGSLKPQGNRY